MGVFKIKSDLIHSISQLENIDYSANPEIGNIYKRLTKGRDQFETAMSKSIQSLMQISSLDLVLSQGTDKLVDIANNVMWQ